MKVNLKTLFVFAPLFLISAFSKPFMLFVLIMANFVYLLLVAKKRITISKKGAIFTFLLLTTNISTTIYQHQNPTFLLNNLLFFLFISPILMLILTNFNKSGSLKPLSERVIKHAIELYLAVQILFSFINGLKRAFENGFRLDVDFGDIIAGTFRPMLVYYTDSSNVTFSFTMILVLFIYITYYKRNCNKIIVVVSLLTIFLASVNHLILAAAASLFIVLIWRYPLKALLFTLSIFSLYPIIQPNNFQMIIDRLTRIFSITSLDALSSLSLKGTFVTNFIHDFINHFFIALTTGFGAGTYSSRAALFFTGEYVSSFPFHSMTDMMFNNTYILWKELLASPPWLAGAFHYPYGSLFSMVAEIGVLFTILVFLFLYRQLRNKGIFSRQEIFFILIFFILIGLVDNYYEYFQATFIFFYLILILPPKTHYASRIYLKAAFNGDSNIINGRNNDS